MIDYPGNTMDKLNLHALWKSFIFDERIFSPKKPFRIIETQRGRLHLINEYKTEIKSVYLNRNIR